MPGAIIERDAIRAIVIADDSEILLLRIQPPDSTDTFWITPGGGLDPGETVDQGLRRELLEELGLRSFDVGPVVWRRQHTFNWGGKRICQREHYHVLEVPRFDPVMSDPIESAWVSTMRWWSLADLASTRERLTPLSLADIVSTYLRDGPPASPPQWEVLVD